MKGISETLLASPVRAEECRSLLLHPWYRRQTLVAGGTRHSECGSVLPASVGAVLLTRPEPRAGSSLSKPQFPLLWNEDTSGASQVVRKTKWAAWEVLGAWARAWHRAVCPGASQTCRFTPWAGVQSSLPHTLRAVTFK